MIFPGFQEFIGQFRQTNGQRYYALQRTINKLSEKMDMLQQDIQTAIDQIALNTNAEASAAAALSLLATQVTDLKSQLANVQPGQVVDPATVAALQNATTNLQTSLAGLTSAIPASVPPAPPAPPAP